MNKLLAVSLMGVVGSVSASELDLSDGQWSFDIKTTDASLYTATETYEDSSLNEIQKDGDQGLNINTVVKYGLNDNVIVGADLGLWTFKETSAQTTNGNEDFDVQTTDSGVTLNPFVYYALNPELSLYGELSLYTSGAAIVRDTAGNESYNGNNRRDLIFSGGLAYKKDLKPNLMLEVLGTVGFEDIRSTNPDDTTDTYEWESLLAETTATTRYFLADNFSANGTAGLYFREKTAERNNGLEVSINDDQYKRLAFGVSAGFTYYFR